MLTDNECIIYLENMTGKKLGVDFGFITGTHHPFGSSGMQSASKIVDYQMWNKVRENTYKLNAYPDTQENTLKYITNFVNLSSISPEDFETYLVKTE